ncbi:MULTISPECIES: PilZ domain-containing protein [Rhizobium]|nr:MULTISPECIES: PilZ domain-containing protein [Rhizobium]RKE80258.1 biotin carboxyl carrier protein [Rhizobium sp. AG855]
MRGISYEAELQRQHPRYPLPMKATIDGREYDVHDWSMNGFAINAKGFSAGKKVMAHLTIPFSGYHFSLTHVPSEVLYATDSEGRTSLVFTALEDSQISLLRYMTDAIISGEVVRAGDVLDVARRTDMVRSKQVPPPPRLSTGGRIAQLGRRVAATAGVAAIGAALVAFLSANVYDELYVVRPESASIAAKTVNVASPAVGRITFLNEKAQLAFGEPLITVNPAVGDPITVESPCDCVQTEQRFASGDFVRTGDPIVRLMRADAPIVVSAAVSDNKLMSLYGVKSASLVYPDGTHVSNAEILWLPGKGGSQSDLPRDPLTVLIAPNKTLSTDMIGQPVEVRFDLFGESAIGRLVHTVAGVFGTETAAQEIKP